MAESVDALVSNTSGETHPGSSPGLGTSRAVNMIALFLEKVSMSCETKTIVSSPIYKNKV